MVFTETNRQREQKAIFNSTQTDINSQGIVENNFRRPNSQNFICYNYFDERFGSGRSELCWDRGGAVHAQIKFKDDLEMKISYSALLFIKNRTNFVSLLLQLNYSGTPRFVQNKPTVLCIEAYYHERVIDLDRKLECNENRQFSENGLKL